ncbi:MAG: acyclic terpene utilization AtuA family protein [Propionibacteriaceae bacterium]|nr:acyclic terpene utilization AtuA family protein [Propionibacteriaceae bacterium]
MTSEPTTQTIRIGGASGAWGDSPGALGQLLDAGVDYLMMDYLAEVTMSLLARSRLRDPNAGYAPDAVGYLLPHLDTLAGSGTKVVSNGGGVNPEACKAQLEAAITERGLDLTVGVVTGDDVSDLIAPQGEGAAARYLSANAYLGALPIKAALDAGADIVLTGRCADSALAVGILMHEFGWGSADLDELASASLVGHLLECGPQATGGNFTDWDEVPGWGTIGYPIAICEPTGDFTITKPDGTGGLVDTRCLTEQLFYEIGDPARYILPDVVADFSDVVLTQVDDDHVRVTGVVGHPPTRQYKVSATRQTGFKSVTSVAIAGPQAVAKAEKTAEEFLARAQKICEDSGAHPITDHRIEVLGAESVYGVPERARAHREVLLRLVMTHPQREILDRIAREVGSIGLGFAPGVMGLYGGRPKSSPQIVLETRFVDKEQVPAPLVHVGGAEPVAVEIPGGQESESSTPHPPTPAEPSAFAPGRRVPLGAIAHARSGDKGDSSNIALIARHPDFYPLLAQVDEAMVRAQFAPQVFGRIERFDVPGLSAVNFLIQEALGGGGIASLRIDPQGKAYGQMMLEALVAVPDELVDSVDPLLIKRFNRP